MDNEIFVTFMQKPGFSENRTRRRRLNQFIVLQLLTLKCLVLNIALLKHKSDS